MQISRNWKISDLLKLTTLGIAMGAVLSSSAADASRYMPGQVIVKYKSGALRTRSMMTQMYGALGVQNVKRLVPGTERLVLSPNVKVEDAIAVLSQVESVEYAQPNYILSLPEKVRNVPPPIAGAGTPCIPGMDIPGCDPNACIIPGLPFPPGCTDDGTPGGGGERPAIGAMPADVIPAVADPDLAKAYGLANVQADKAWAIHRGSKEMIVADIDTGVDYNHEDIAFNMWRNPTPSTKNDVVGFDFIHNDGLPFDDQGHGTHTSGTIGATGGNGKAISGVSQRVSIMAVKFLSGKGEGSTDGAIQSIDYATQNGAKIMNASWGGEGDDNNKGLYDAIDRARVKGVLFIAAAGNGGSDQMGDDNDSSPHKSYPASFDNDNLISVAATDKSDKLVFFSNYGVKTTHLAAPGMNIESTLPNNKYGAESGTSMACPHVAGAAALVWSAHPDWTYQQVKKALIETTDVQPSLQGKVASGGRLNVLKAIQYKF